MNLRKTVGPATWERLTEPQRDLLKRLFSPTVDGIWVAALSGAERGVADALLVMRLVEWRDAILRLTADGVRVVVQESGLLSKAVGA